MAMKAVKLKTQLVKPHFSLVLKQEQKNLVDYVEQELKDLELSKLKLDPDFLKYLAEIIENQVKERESKDESKPSKMDILVEILKRVFPQISDEAIDDAKQIVEFLLKNDMVKKTPLSKIICFYLKKRFFTG
jgi:hypothetical protein